MLAMTDDREEEESIKEWLASIGYKKAVATEVSGPLADFKQKVMKNAVAAALHTGIIENDPRKLHGLVHAVLEATQGILIAALANPSIKVKMGIVTDDKWVAVGMFGVTALHVCTNHERAGLGVMHL
ncbi:hypothetical protein MGLY_09720 [Neomoorella glycerini]|uniref:Hut operon positive regulatory protein n=2 Tax=Neomoorella glycerini TaxID=55779 RepID=A0A6I5ZQ19_9FIRM|nr:hypothetical protein MGLY_09720 [Moorella glycerini]